ncbi:MAG: GAF domain-containing protein [Pyrinomonadaceae bacterium]|nr:GAF domain-containing protein [Pyrinomonadaceae bacterium]
MAEEIAYSENAARSVKYSEIIPQLAALVEGERDVIANLANIVAVLKEAFGFFWVGFYMEKEGELVLGPFQGPVACTRIGFDEGVCGHAFTIGETVVVKNVEEFPGHIACSSESKSEIVLPLFGPEGRKVGVLDVDSDRLDDFSEADEAGLNAIVKIITERVL